MKPLRRGLLAAAFTLALPLAAAAQSLETSWYSKSSDDSGRRQLRVRPVVSLEDTAEDLEHRLEVLRSCSLLTEINGRTILDEIVSAPNFLLDATASVLAPIPDRHEHFSIRAWEEGPILSRVFAQSLKEPGERPFGDMVSQFVLREQKYFAKFQDSYLSTVGVEDGQEDINVEGLMADQHKVMFDAMRKFYFGRLGSKMDDRLRDESLDVGNWEAIDFVVAPTILAGFLYVRGWEKRFTAAGLTWSFQLESIRRILERRTGSHNDLVSAASLEIGFGDFPVKAIVSAGIQDGDFLMDFIGIGTSLGKAKQVVAHELGVIEE